MNYSMESFAGYCPQCDKKVAPDASFCHHCGRCLMLQEDEKKSVSTSALPTPAELEDALENTTYLFMAWLFTFSLTMASVIFQHFYHQSSFLIISGVLFFYTWIFFISKLDELAQLVNKKLSKLVYLSLLIPVVGTIFCYGKVSADAKHRLNFIASQQ